LFSDVLALPLDVARFVRGAFLYDDDSTASLAEQLAQHARERPGALFLRFESETFTYAAADALINRHAQAYVTLGIKPKDTVALVLENGPAFLWHMLGLHKLGAITSLINTNLSGHTLAHALRICEPRAIAVSRELWPRVYELRGELGAGAPALLVDGAGQAPEAPAQAFDGLLAAAPPTPPDRALRPTLNDVAAYIYTSGTTGLPKAALVRHSRLYRAGVVWARLALRYRRGDVMYCCLPLYHSNATLLAVGSVITAGATLALARKFSRTRFWDDVRAHGATQIIYIGELCRYLMNAEPSPRDREHRVRIITGNGMRPDIWEAFQARFGIERVVEFYAATEGNCITLNPVGWTGSVGPLMPGMVIVRWDEAEQRIVRDANGRCVRAARGEPGILLGRIGKRSAFDGYRDAKATEQKIVRDVLEPGDAYFNTGDLLRMGPRRRLYFVDRVGDTFRWKGENVSTTEVQEALSSHEGVAEANAYGVRIPGTEGRAGMVALVMADGARFDPARFKQHADARLPGYARPLFVRVAPQLETTATFKLKKQDLQEQGFDPAKVSDPIFVRDPQKDAYVPLDAELYARLQSGALKL
jgi:acyl-CoA synthetase (AMP-forming)/AMP-acid ligase II